MRAKQEDTVVKIHFVNLKGESQEGEVLNRGIIEHIIKALPVEAIVGKAYEKYESYASDGIAYLDIRTGELKSGGYSYEEGYNEDMMNIPCIFLFHISNHSQADLDSLKSTEPNVEDYLYWVIMNEFYHGMNGKDEYTVAMANRISKRAFEGERWRRWNANIKWQIYNLYSFSGGST